MFSLVFSQRRLYVNFVGKVKICLGSNFIFQGLAFDLLEGRQTPLSNSESVDGGHKNVIDFNLFF